MEHCSIGCDPWACE